MPRPLVLVDLDRTLFDTSTFFDEIWRLAHDIYGVDATAQKARAEEFFDWYDAGYDYRFFDHLAAAAGATFSKTALEDAARREFSDRFLYPDVTDEVIGLIDAIVTFGGWEYQTFKLSLCPQLAHIAHHISLTSKAEYIARTFSGPALLVDDKQLENEIMAPTRFVRIDRSLAKSDIASSVIHSLEDIPACLGEGSDITK